MQRCTDSIKAATLISGMARFSAAGLLSCVCLGLFPACRLSKTSLVSPYSQVAIWPILYLLAKQAVFFCGSFLLEFLLSLLLRVWGVAKIKFPSLFFLLCFPSLLSAELLKYWPWQFALFSAMVQPTTYRYLTEESIHKLKNYKYCSPSLWLLRLCPPPPNLTTIFYCCHSLCRYASGLSSILDTKIMTPFWNYTVQFLPMWIA